MNINDPIPEPMVRPYTTEEQFLVRPTGIENAAAKIARIIRTAEIDRQRYREAMQAHPHKKEHFERLIHVSSLAVEQWATYYQEQSEAQEITVGAVPYDGNESPVVVPVHVTEPPRAALPA